VQVRIDRMAVYAISTRARGAEKGHEGGGEVGRSATTVRWAWLSVLFASATVVGCGGGGTPAPPPYYPPPEPIPAVTSVPTPVGYSDRQMAAFDRLNELRAQAGLGLLAQSMPLDASANAHAMWEVTNDIYGHDETPGTPGFTGVSFRDRIVQAGYGWPNVSGEVITAGYAPSNAVDALVQVPYHRQAVLAFELVDIGVGWSDVRIPSDGTPLVLDLGVPQGSGGRSNGQTARVEMGGIVVWPADGAHGVWCAMGGEFPNPVPGKNMYAVGTPISIGVDPLKILRVTSFTLHEHLSGSDIAMTLLDEPSDPNHMIFANFAASIPNEFLKHLTAYDVDFQGTLDGVPFEKKWAFTTGVLDAPLTGY